MKYEYSFEECCAMKDALSHLYNNEWRKHLDIPLSEQRKGGQLRKHYIKVVGNALGKMDQEVWNK